MCLWVGGYRWQVELSQGVIGLSGSSEGKGGVVVCLDGVMYGAVCQRDGHGSLGVFRFDLLHNGDCS